MATIDGGRVIVTLEGRDVNLSEMLAKVTSQTNTAGQAARSYAMTIEKLDAETKQTENQIAAFAQGMARAAAASGDYGAAVQILGNAMNQLTPNTQKGIAVMTQLQTMLNKYSETSRTAAFAAQQHEAAIATQAQAAARAQVAMGNYGNAIQILSGAMGKIAPNTTTANNVLAQLHNTLNKQDAAIKKSDNSIAQLAQSMARASAAAGNYGRAAEILNNAMGQVTPNSSAANNLSAQLTQTLERQAEATTAARSGLTNFAKALQGMVGIYFAVSGATQAFTDSIKAGMELEKIDATFRALSGSQQAYEKNLAQAKEQQKLFGGSLKETMDDMSGLIVLSKNTGISLKDLTNTVRAMATVDWAQGPKGATIALKELFSGEISSLARR